MGGSARTWYRLQFAAATMDLISVAMDSWNDWTICQSNCTYASEDAEEVSAAVPGLLTARGQDVT